MADGNNYLHLGTRIGIYKPDMLSKNLLERFYLILHGGTWKLTKIYILVTLADKNRLQCL